MKDRKKAIKTKKIIICTPSISTGGLGSYLINLINGLPSNGWAVHLITTNSPGNLFEDMKQRITTIDFSDMPLSLKKVFKAADKINQISPDIILLNNVPLIHYALPLILPAIRPVVVLHSDDLRFYKTAALFSRRIFRWVAPTVRLAQRCQDHLFAELKTRVRIIPHGVRTDNFYQNQTKTKFSERHIIFIGYLAENKGADLLPDIMQRLLDYFPKTKLILIGVGPLRTQLEKRFREQKIIDRCKFLGRVNHNEAAKQLRESDILLLPTRIEGFGLTIVEAMLSGTVPIVSRLKGITDNIIHDNVTGFLVEPDDVKGFAESIIYLLKNPERLKAMSDKTVFSAAKDYSASRMIDDYELLFAEDDDRDHISPKNGFGWLSETIGVILKHGVDWKWIKNRIPEILK